PNPLFGDGFYLTVHPDVRQQGLVPLVHYLQFGCQEGRLVSPVHRSMVQQLRRTSRLTRGAWRRGTVLLFCERRSAEGVAALGGPLARDHRLTGLVIARERSGSVGVDAAEPVLFLDDFR